MKKEKKCSLFEEMLMWTSYRYAIGSKTYVASLAYDIPQHYYNKLSPERRRFTAEDIRKEIYEHLRFLPFGYQIHRMTKEDKFNPLDTLFTFIQAQGVGSYDELLTYANINYDAHTGKYLFERKVPQIKTYFTVNDLDDLLPWETFASCFDDTEHIVVNGKTMFRTWRRRLVPVPDRKDSLRKADFGWEPIWYDLDTFVNNGKYAGYLTEEEVPREAMQPLRRGSSGIGVLPQQDKKRRS